MDFKEPSALADWYAKNLGISPSPTDMETLPWTSTEGATVFAPFALGTDYFEEDRQFMLNFRVGDLDAMLAQLREADIEVSHEEAMEGVGRFARIHDPEGNPIELWEPAG